MKSFLLSIREQAMENCGRFVFYNNIYFVTKNQKQNTIKQTNQKKTKNQKKKQKKKKRILRDMLRHLHGLYSHRPQLSTNQRARIHSVIVKFRVHALQSSHVPVDSRYWFQVSGTWILDSNCQWDSRLFDLYSVFQSSGFQIADSTNKNFRFRNPESLTHCISNSTILMA